MNYKDGGFVQMSEAAREDGSDVAHEKLSHEFVADEPGYVYIYLSNDGIAGSGEAFFDDFEINSSESYIVQTIDYYPYGLVASNWKRESEKATKDLFQGKTYEELTQWSDFHARQYDAAVGRWFGVDPQGQFASPYVGMGNNPVMMVDPDGELAWFVPMIIGAVIGGTSQGIASANNGGTFLGGFWKGALVGGAAGFAAVGATAALAGTTLAGTASAGFGAVAAGGAIGGAVNGAGFAALNGGDVGRGIWAGAIGGGFGAMAGAGVSGLLGNGGGFVDGFARGAIGGGATGGVNAALSGQDLGRGIWMGAAIGGAIGGTIQGIDARRAGVNFFSGTGRFDLSSGVGAHNIPEGVNLKDVYGKYKGSWNGTNIFESKDLGTYSHSQNHLSGGITLPGRGIYVGKGVYTRNYDSQLLMHEFGHELQSRAMGKMYFYSKIATSSLQSATFNPGSHRYHWTEIWANQLAYDFFSRGWSGSTYWDVRRFPLNP